MPAQKTEITSHSERNFSARGSDELVGAFPPEESTVRAEDGSHISRADAGTPVRCDVCGHQLGDEQWWVTAYPRAEHTRCRDWAAVPYPFKRHLALMSKLRRTLDGEAREYVVLTERWLKEQLRMWPEPGAQGVIKASRLLVRLRARLVACEVSTKVVNQL